MACGIAGPVVFNVSAGQTFTEDAPVITVNSTITNTLKFRKFGAGTNPVIRPTGGVGTTDAGITIAGSDYVTFDGIDINIATGTAVEYGYFVRNNSATDGATNDSIKNCTISLSRTVSTTRGIFQNIATVPTSAAGANSNNTFMNFTITNAYAGVVLTGNATFPDLNTQVITSACNIYNIIGNPAIPMDIGGGTLATASFGISATSQSGFTIKNCKISNVATTGITDGILVTTFQGTCTIANNFIQGIKNNLATSVSTVTGIRMSHTLTLTHTMRCYNNSISNITNIYTGAASAARSLKGIHVFGTGGVATTTYEIVNNSVSIDGSASPNISSTCFEQAAIVVKYTIQNNIFANFTIAQGATAKHYCFVNLGSATVMGGAGTTVKNNDLYFPNDVGVSGFTALGLTTNYNTVALWQAVNPLATLNVSIDPQFLNNASDLHVNNTALDAQGTTYLVYVTVDLDCATRTGTPDIGAYLIVPCTGQPTAGTTSASPASICPGGSSLLSSVGFSSGVTFQWVSSTVSGGPYTAIGGATSFNYNTGALFANTYYKLVVTCTSSSLQDSSAEVAVSIIAAPSASVSPAGPLSACAGAVVPLTASTNAITPVYQWKRNGVDIAGATASTFTPTQTGSYTVAITDSAAPAACPGLSIAVIDTVYPLPPTSASATPTSLCDGDSSQLNANVFISGLVTTPLVVGNSSSATGFDLQNTSTGPITIHFLTFTATVAGTLSESVYYNPTPMNCVFPTNVTTAPGWVLIGTASCTSLGAAPNLTLIPIDLNITIPVGQTYAFALGGASVAYTTGTSGCPTMASDGNLLVKEGFGGTLTGTIANRRWNGSVTYSYGDPNATVSWSPAASLNSQTAVNPVATPPIGTTTYTVTVTGTGGCTNSSTVSVTNLGIPDPAPTTTSDTVCAGDSAHLAASGLSTLNWYTAQTGGILKHTGATWDSVWTATTTYWVESNNGNCPSSRTSVTVTVVAIPTLNATATPNVLCFGDSAQLASNNFTTASVTMLPQGSLFAGNVRGYSFTAPVSFTITGLQDLGNGAGNQSIAVVKFVPAVQPPIFAATTNAFTTLFLTQNNANLGVIPVSININAGDVIGVLSQRGTNSSYSTPVGPYLTSIAGQPVTLTRMGMQFALSTTAPQDLWTETAAAVGRCQITYAIGDPNVTFNWQPSGSLNNNTLANPMAGPASTTTYTVTATNLFGCTNTSTASVTVNPVPPSPTIDSVTNIFCGCGNATIHAVINGTGTIIRWFDAAIGGTLLGTGSPFITPLFCGPKTFYAEEFDPGTGCASITRSSVLITPTIAVPINAGADVVLCDGAFPAGLSASSTNACYQYSWSPALGLNVSTGASVLSNPGVNTTYIVTGTDTCGSGCVTKDTVTVFVGITPIISSISASPANVCSGDTSQLNVIASIPGGSVIGFTGAYTPGSWTTQHSAGDLGVVNLFNSATLNMNSSDGGTGATDIDVIHTVTASGNITFNWSYTTADIDGPSFDYPQYYKNGVRTIMPGFNTAGATSQTGTASIPVLAGDVFGFNMHTLDNVGGAATADFTNLVFPGSTAVFTYAWSPATGLTSTNVSNPKSVPPVGTTTYTVIVSNNGCTSTGTISVTASVTPPAPVVVGDTVCGPDTVHVSATPSNVLNSLLWTDTIGGQIINSGTTYAQYVTQSGSFYVTEAAGAGSTNVGYSGIDAASGFFPDAASFMNFTVINPEGVIINTVQVSTNLGAGTWPLVIALSNTSGQIVSVHDTIFITGGSTTLQTISLNMFVPQGSWRLQPILNPNLSVHQLAAVTASLPWTIPGIINITCFGNASSACFATTPTGTFGMFYYWNISTVCNSLQSIVNYVVTPSSPVGIASSAGMFFCDSASTILSAVDSVGGIYDTYDWAPATGLNATTGGSVTVTGLAQTTTYILTAHDTDGDCNAQATKTITVQPKPTLLLSYHDTTICRTEPSLPFNSTAAKSSVVQIGTRTDPNFVVGVVYGGNTTQYSQMILTPAELNAAGLFGPTNITSLAFFVSGKLTTTTYIVDIEMRSDVGIPAVFPSTAHINTGLTTVYNNPAITSSLGWNTYSFSTPFAWDGVSNVLVSECFTHNIPGFFDIVYTSSVGVARFNALNATACGAAAGALLNDRPNVRFTGGTVFYNWSPAAGLSSATVEDPVMTPNFFGVDTALYYQLTVTDPLSGCTATDSIHVVVSSTPPTPQVAFIGDSVLCFTGSPKMRAYATSGSLQWQISTDSVNFVNILGATDDTLNAAAISVTRYYRIFANCGDTAYSRIMTVVVNNPQIVSTIPDTVCGFGQVCLSATQNQANYDVQWYNTATGGTLLDTGNTYCTNISSTTTFYAQASTQGGAPVTAPYFNYTTTLGANTFPFAQAAGKEVQWFVGPGEFVTPSPAPSGGMITSISFFAGTTGTGVYTSFTLKLGQTSTAFAGGALYSGPLTTVILPANKTIVATIGTWVTLTLDVPFAYDPTQWLVVDVGQCGATGGFNVYQNTLTGIRRVWSVGGCPFVWTSNDATLPGITLGLTTGSQCVSPRVPVVAVSTPPPAMSTVSHTVTICESSCGTIGVDAPGIANYQAFSWSPSIGLTTTTGSSIQACPIVNTTYTVTAIDTIGGCQKTDTVKVIVNPAPTISPSSTPSLLCQGDSAQLLSGAGGGTPTNGLLTTPLTTGNGSSCIGFDVQNTSLVPVTIHFLSFTASVTGTLSESVYYSTTPLNCTAPANVTIAPGWTLIGTASCTSTGLTPILTLIPLDLNITIPPGSTYAFALGGASVGYNGTGTTCVLTPIASDANLTLKMGFGGTLTGTINFRGFTGSISYSTGSTQTLTNLWTPPTGLSNTAIDNPKASPASTTTYTVTVTNTITGCTKSGSVTVNVTPKPKPYVVEGDSTLCSNDPGFYIHVKDSGAYSGGYPPGTTFEFVGLTPPTNTDDSTFVSSSTTTLVIVTLPPFLGGCTKATGLRNIDFGSTQAAQIGMSTDSVKCFGGATGNAYATITFGGTANFRWQWYNSGFNSLLRDVTNASMYDSLKGVPAGMYIVVLTDHQGATTSPYCQIVDSVYVGQPVQPLAVNENTLNHVNVLCNGALTGAVDIDVSGGTPSYSYNWSNGSSSQDLTATGAGTYTCTITDSRGCTATISVTITQLTAIVVNCSSTNAICFNANNGTVSVSASGGTPGYSYLWSNGITTASQSSLAPGTYTVTVTDANGCTKTCSSVVTQPPLVVPTITGSTAICAGSSKTLNAGAGYSAYSWSTGATTQTITVSTAGTFTVTVTNASGCTGSASVTTVVNPLPVPSINGVSAVCTVSTTVISANAVYSSYNWSTGATTQSITVPGGTYTVTVSNTFGCTSSASKTIAIVSTVPAQPGVITGSNVVCKNSNGPYSIATVPGATSYTWTAVSGASVSTGQGSTSVVINFSIAAVSANLNVVANNVCGASVPRTLAYTVTTVLPAQPVTINGPLYGLCNKTNVAYNCPAVLNAASYLWTVPAGVTILTGQGTTAITVKYTSTFTNTGTLSVAAVNGCGSSAPLSKTVNAKPQQPVISGLNWACKGQPGLNYSVAPVFGATSYTWTIVAGSVLVSGQGTTAIVVNWGQINGVIKCKANNACGSSSLPGQLSVSFTCKQAGTLEDFSELSIYPNPATTSAEIQFDGFAEGKGQLEVYDLVGQRVLQEDLPIVTGSNQYKLDLSNLAKGAYTVKVIYNGLSRNCKLIVQ
ncbi:MAG: T9SS type A sorting domain-containing protein [Bacteroidia bacterium]